MYALVMKWREGRESAIKGMVMPMVKRMGTCGASGIRRCRGEAEQLKRTSSGEQCEEEGSKGDEEGEGIYAVRLHQGYR